MSREIKFRAWVMAKVGEQGWMGEVISLKWAGPLDGAYVRAVEHEPIFYRVYQFELMQWTGLKDKTGHDIYEGDIVRLYDDRMPKEHREQIVQVTFEHGCFLFGGFFSYGLIGQEVTVIGNVHEHPDLLKEAKRG